MALGFLFYGDKITVISIYCLLQIGVVILFAIKIIWYIVSSSIIVYTCRCVKFKTTHLAELVFQFFNFL